MGINFQNVIRNFCKATFVLASSLVGSYLFILKDFAECCLEICVDIQLIRFISY